MNDISYQFHRVLEERETESRYLQYGQFIDVNVFQFGREQCESLHSYGPAVRNHYLFHYIVSGKGELVSTDRNDVVHTYQLHAGDGFLIVPQQVTTYRADKDEPWEYLWLEFDGSNVSKPLIAAGLDQNHPIWQPRDDSFRKDVLKIMEELISNHDKSAYFLIGYTFLFLDLLLRSGRQDMDHPKNRVKDYYISIAVSYIERNYASDLSIGDIASVCGLNRSYFSKIFKEVMGVTPQQYLLRYRMSQACNLLKHSRTSVKDIGLAVGYPDQLHFSRAFKASFHMSPREWRKQNLK